jgi:hypothetical protein
MSRIEGSDKGGRKSLEGKNQVQFKVAVIGRLPLQTREWF